MSEKFIGTVTHYYGKAHVAGIKMTAGEAHVGDTIHVLGHTSDFGQTVESIEIEHEPVESAVAGNQIGIQVRERVRPHDEVYIELQD